MAGAARALQYSCAPMHDAESWWLLPRIGRPLLKTMPDRRHQAQDAYCPHCGGLQGHWAHRRSDCLYELRARMRYLLTLLYLGNASDPADTQRAIARLEQRIEDLLAHRVVYAPV